MKVLFFGLTLFNLVVAIGEVILFLSTMGTALNLIFFIMSFTLSLASFKFLMES